MVMPALVIPSGNLPLLLHHTESPSALREAIDLAEKAREGTGQSKVVTLTTHLYRPLRTSIMSGPMTEGILGPLPVYPKEKVEKRMVRVEFHLIMRMSKSSGRRNRSKQIEIGT